MFVPQEQSRVNKQERSERLLREGRERFIRELEGQLNLIAALIQRLRNGHSADASKLYGIFHTMKGSAPIFGLKRIGTVFGELADVWEWTQEDNPASDAGRLIEESLERSSRLLNQMLLEYEVSSKELEMEKRGGRIGPKLTASGRLLVIDDDDVLRSYLRSRLELDGYTVMEAADVESAKKLLREWKFDLVMLDLMMSPQSGYDLFEYLKEDATLKWLPLIVLSGREDLQDKVQCFYLGADDYVTKPFQYEELSARIYGLLTRSKNVENMAFRDPLTGAYNRRYFDHQFSAEIQRVERYPAPLSVVFIDIDRFKQINDAYGHAVGDMVLQGLAHLLQRSVRGSDLVARYGGEEFVLMLPATGGHEALRLMEDIRQQVHGAVIARDEESEYRITFSAGICEWLPGLSREECLNRADKAMYDAKHQGRNRVLLAATGQESSGSIPELRRPRVLVADDDDILRSILVSSLEPLPIDLVSVHDGEAAYKELLAGSVDLCLLDAVMPGRSGFELLRMIRDELPGKSIRHVKSILLTARNNTAAAKRAAALGADEFLAKPFSPVELSLLVRRLLNLPSDPS
ncbi:diguanylate cyclase [Paenibacillus beijingensis]|uniref:Diguanylate cyclase n=1 Tax=Paenibacillus beijingensis TaxID=1126833 RepID=A0A0D5NKQ9_9BACL|nr:diguanylate cyclase [Paenibacillus beijingensis]AJY75700.1 hypothetical protein VN24_15505 [Paenibacillus beijingensis]